MLLDKMNKPSQYFVGLSIILVLFEVFLISSPTVFSNLTERLNLKSAMFTFRDTTEVLFLGSSRSKDGISPKLVTKAIKENEGLDISAFNGALTGTNIQKFETFFNKSISKPGLKLVVIEVSYPHLYFDEKYTTDIPEAKDFEESLQNILLGNIKMAAWRKSFRIENFIKAPAILMADYLEGSELYRAHLIKDFLDTRPYQFTPEDRKLWNPIQISPLQGPGTDGGDCAMHILQDVTKLAKDNDVQLLFVIPPLVNDRKELETNQLAQQFYQRIANKTGHTILDYSAIDLPETIFSDLDSHLNKQGRHLFSNALAIPVNQSIKK